MLDSNSVLLGSHILLIESFVSGFVKNSLVQARFAKFGFLETALKASLFVIPKLRASFKEEFSRM